MTNLVKPQVTPPLTAAEHFRHERHRFLTRLYSWHQTSASIAAPLVSKRFTLPRLLLIAHFNHEKQIILTSGLPLIVATPLATEGVGFLISGQPLFFHSFHWFSRCYKANRRNIRYKQQHLIIVQIQVANGHNQTTMRNGYHQYQKIY